MEFIEPGLASYCHQTLWAQMDFMRERHLFGRNPVLLTQAKQHYPISGLASRQIKDFIFTQSSVNHYDNPSYRSPLLLQALTPSSLGHPSPG
jgi:hypothetical protein